MNEEEYRRNISCRRMVDRIGKILKDNQPSIYMYGSCVMNDFRLGWSDIDILVLTQEQISQEQANELVVIRGTMKEQEPDNVYYRLVEGGMLTLSSFISGKDDRVVYLGTSGERITNHYDFDSFCMTELLTDGVLLHGKEVRNEFNMPTYSDLCNDILRHYEIIRKYVQKTDRSYYSFGWFLDISRCIYTMRTGKIIAKTIAGEHALHDELCPDSNALKVALEVRKNPLKYKDDTTIFDYAETLGESVQRYADVLEHEMKLRKATKSI